MRVHHLNCGTMCPFSARFVNSDGALLDAGRMVCHCLLVETDDGLLLVDTGLGLEDTARGRQRLGQGFLWAARPRLDPDETAARQVERLGFARSDVRHIFPTHLDLDHAGGMPDFPDATVHIFELEHTAAMAPRDMLERSRYRPPHWAHGPRWKIHALDGERWFGFDSVRAWGGASGEVLVVPLLGHSRGHSGIAVRTERGWLLHAGDAYFSHREMDPTNPSCPGALDAFQRIAAVSNRKRLANQARLRELARDHAGEVEVFCAHCPETFERHATPDPARRRAPAGVAVPTT